MGKVYAADLGNRTIAVALQQRYHFPAEIRVIEQQAAHIRCSFMFNIKEATGGRLSLGRYNRSKHADFPLRMSVWLPACPSPIGRPVLQAVIGHQWMVSQG
jgi:hypothetical protein